MNRGRACRAIVPRFAPTSFSTADFRWQHEEGWNDDALTSFVRFRQAPAAGLFQPPYPVTRRGHPGPVMVGRWVLQSEAGVPLAVAEAHAHQTQFNVVTLLISDAIPYW